MHVWHTLRCAPSRTSVLAERVRKWAADSPFFVSVMKAIDSVDEGWKICLLLRLSPLMPYALINYLLSSTQLTFWTYTWCTAIGVLPPTALYVYLGTTAASLSDILGDAFGTPDSDDETPAAPSPAPTIAEPTAPVAPVPLAPSAAPSAMDTTQLWVMGIGVVVTVAVAVLVTVFTSRAIKRASRLVPGGIDTADAILDGESATDDDDIVALDGIEDDDENSIQMKDLSGIQIRSDLNREFDIDMERDYQRDRESSRNGRDPSNLSLASSITSETELLGSNSSGGLDRSGISSGRNLALSRSSDIPADDSEPDDSDILSRSSANSTTPFNKFHHTPASSRLSPADPHSSV